MRLRQLVLVIAVLSLVSGCGATKTKTASVNACAAFTDYQGHSGTTVKIYSPIRDVEADKLVKSWEQFETCTGVVINYEGSDAFETNLAARVVAGKAPDLSFFPQPGLVAGLARSGALKPAGTQMAANVDKYFSPEWKQYGTVEGKLYAAPIDANVKSFVWYSPKYFAAKGYAVPTTWDEMLALSDKIAADGVKPWCAGIESGQATGWPLTDWLEDVLLRTSGADVYDQWVNHTIPFDDPRVAAALDRVGHILKNPAYVNGGYGDVKSIATTSFQEGGLPILANKCAMHRQASFYTTWWPADAKVAQDGDIYAFYLPTIDATMGRPVEGAGDFVAAFNTRPEVQAVAAYLTTPDFANNRARFGGVVSPNRQLDKEQLSTPIEKLSATMLTDARTTFRFDGSDMMPAAVGSGTFWKEMTAWINGEDTATALRRIEASWPPG